MEAVEDCTSRLIVQDERDEIQAATALTGQCVDVVDALQELRPVNTDGWLTNGGRRDVPGSDGSHAMRGWLTAPASEDWQRGPVSRFVRPWSPSSLRRLQGNQGSSCCLRLVDGNKASAVAKRRSRSGINETGSERLSLSNLSAMQILRRNGSEDGEAAG